MNVMLDIETLGTKPGCVVLSVGAVAFDRKTGRIASEFYKIIDPKDSQKNGLTCDAGTVVWWMAQSDEARTAISGGGGESLLSAADSFATWFKSQGDVGAIWAQGMDFDMPIWGHAMEAVGVPRPWAFWACRDTRTAYDLYGFNPKSIIRSGDYHNALDDARHQVECLTAAINKSAAQPIPNF